MTMESKEISIGANAPDASLERRPGVPMEHEPTPVGYAHWQTPPRQEPDPRVLKRADLDQLTATFSSALPPRGLSGVLRRVAYGIPDYYARRWFILMMADRVDALEHRLMKPTTWLAIAGVGLLVAQRAKARSTPVARLRRMMHV